MAGFTKEGQSDGRLYVWDLDEGRGWPSTPAKAARQRDFYRLENDPDNPTRVETGLGLAETAAAPILQRVIETRTLPDADDLGVLLIFIALLESRGSAMREAMIQVTEESTLDRLRKIFENEGRWTEIREKIRAEGYDVDAAPGRLEMLRAVMERRIRITSPQDLMVSWVGRMFIVLFPWLRERNWALLEPPADRPVEFLTSDKPLTIEWSRPSPTSQRNPQFDDRLTDVLIPLSRRCALLGRYEAVASGPTELSFAAALNNRQVRSARRYLYSPVQDFEILHEDDSVGPVPGLRRFPIGQEPWKNASAPMSNGEL